MPKSRADKRNYLGVLQKTFPKPIDIHSFFWYHVGGFEASFCDAPLLDFATFCLFFNTSLILDKKKGTIMAKKYPIGFWNYPSVTSTPLSEVARWAECGITCNQTPTFSYADHDPAQLTAFLDEMHANGMQAFPFIRELDFHRYTANPEDFRAAFERAYADFGHHPAVLGFFIGDEPLHKPEFDACVHAYNIMRELAPELTPLLNFNPYWLGIETDFLGGIPFADWLDNFIDASGCPLICYDCYVQMNPEDEGTNMYFLNLNLYTSAAKRKGIKVFNTALSVGHFRYRVPSEDDLRWQLSTTVASGCDGLLWFLYYGQNAGNNYRGAPIDELGEESDTYRAMRRVQRIFHRRYGELIPTLTHEKAWHFCKAYGNYPLYLTYEIPHLRKCESVHGLPGIISSFRDAEGNQYLVLVNNSPKDSGLFQLVFDPGMTRCDRYWDGNKSYSFIANHHDAVFAAHGSHTVVGFYLAPGQMEIIRVEFAE